MKYRIGSFNIRQFSNNSVMHGKGKDSKKDLETIANIVRDYNLDIIAIQEISGKIAFKELISAIAFHYATEIRAFDEREKDGSLSSEVIDDYLFCTAGKWQGRWVKPNSRWGTARAEEGYAFIWNTERFELPKNNRGDIKPVIKHKREIYFIRPPFFGRFVTKSDAKYEIKLLNTHVLYTRNPKLKKLKDSGIDTEMLENEDKDVRMYVKRQMREYGLKPLEINILENYAKQDDIERRKHEVINLISEIMVREEDDLSYLQDDSGKSSYVFMLGDYNLNVFSINPKYSNRKAVIEKSITASTTGDTYTVDQAELTTLKQPPKKEKDPDMEYEKLIGDNRYSNSYDHITYRSDMTQTRGIQINEVKRIDVIEKYGMTNREYFERISDHLPIMFEINLD